MITAELVRELREKTGVGMMDCKKALEHASGNFEDAVKYLREKGLAAATKKADRSATEGREFVAVSADQKSGVILELNCETDFVGGNDAFKELGNTVAQTVLSQGIENLDALQGATIEGKTYTEFLSEAVMKLGENLSVKRFERFQTTGVLGSYVHMNGKIGVLVEFSGTVDADSAKDIAMHIAAVSPAYVRAEEVPQEEVEKEKEIIQNQAANEGKPAAVLEKVVAGKIQKFFKDICLIEQQFVKNQDVTVKQVLAGKADVVRFVRYSL